MHEVVDQAESQLHHKELLCSVAISHTGLRSIPTTRYNKLNVKERRDLVQKEGLGARGLGQGGAFRPDGGIEATGRIVQIQWSAGRRSALDGGGMHSVSPLSLEGSCHLGEGV